MANEIDAIVDNVRMLLTKVATLEKTVQSLQQQNGTPHNFAPMRSFERNHKVFPCVVDSRNLDTNEVTCFRIVPVDSTETEIDENLAHIPIVARLPIGATFPEVDDEIFVSHIGDGNFIMVSHRGAGTDIIPGLVAGRVNSVFGSYYGAQVILYENGYRNPPTSLRFAFKVNPGPMSTYDPCMVWLFDSEYYFWHHENQASYTGQIVGGATNPYGWVKTEYFGGPANGGSFGDAYEVNGSTSVASGTHVQFVKVNKGVTFTWDASFPMPQVYYATEVSSAGATAVNSLDYTEGSTIGQLGSPDYYFSAGAGSGSNVQPTKITSVITANQAFLMDIYGAGYGSAATQVNKTGYIVDENSFNFTVGDHVTGFESAGVWYISSNKLFQTNTTPLFTSAIITDYGISPGEYIYRQTDYPGGSIITTISTGYCYEMNSAPGVSVGINVLLYYHLSRNKFYFFFPVGDDC